MFSNLLVNTVTPWPSSWFAGSRFGQGHSGPFLSLGVIRFHFHPHPLVQSDRFFLFKRACFKALLGDYPPLHPITSGTPPSLPSPGPEILKRLWGTSLEM
ncbi:unnamed protein product [Boreogadus saida]